jgi:hypothetical protein
MVKLSKEDCISTIENMIEDFQYKIKKTKDPKKLRIYKNTLNFWESLIDYLK